MKLGSHADIHIFPAPTVEPWFLKKLVVMSAGLGGLSRVPGGTTPTRVSLRKRADHRETWLEGWSWGLLEEPNDRTGNGADHVIPPPQA